VYDEPGATQSKQFTAFQNPLVSGVSPAVCTGIIEIALCRVSMVAKIHRLWRHIAPRPPSWREMAVTIFAAD